MSRETTGHKHWLITARRVFTISELIKSREKGKITTASDSSPYPSLRPLPDGRWELIEDWHCEYADHKYTVPKGFLVDGASIPKFLWWFYGSPMDYPYSLSATLHDYLYSVGCKEDPDPDGPTRKAADQAFRDYNIQLGLSKFKADTEYIALRLFGGVHWNED